MALVVDGRDSAPSLLPSPPALARRSSSCRSPPPSPLLILSPAFSPSPTFAQPSLPQSPSSPSPPSATFASGARSTAQEASPRSRTTPTSSAMLGVSWATRRASNSDVQALVDRYDEVRPAHRPLPLDADATATTTAQAPSSPAVALSFDDIAVPDRALMLPQRMASYDSASSTETSSSSTTRSISSDGSVASLDLSTKSAASPRLTEVAIAGTSSVSTLGTLDSSLEKEDLTLKRSRSGYGFGALKGWLAGSSGKKGKESKDRPRGPYSDTSAPTLGSPILLSSEEGAFQTSSAAPAPGSIRLDPPVPQPKSLLRRRSIAIFSPSVTPELSPSQEALSASSSSPIDPSPLPLAAPPIIPSSTPRLSPLQSLHLLSSQKLSLLVRPPQSPHPILLTPQRKSGDRRFPSSTNQVAAGASSKRILGLCAELGVRSLMKRLEKGGRASREEVDALERLFKSRPVALTRDRSGVLIASIPTSSNLVTPPDTISSSALQAQLLVAGSGVLAFRSRPAFEARTLVFSLAPSGDVLEGPITAARGLAVVDLEFSCGLDALARDIQEARTRRPGVRPAAGPRQGPPIGALGLIPGVGPAGGRTSPSDESRSEVGSPVVVQQVPKLPDVVYTPAPRVGSPPSSTADARRPLSTPATASSEIVPPSQPSPPRPVARPGPPPSRPSHPPAPLGPSHLAVEDDEDDDELPLAMLVKRSSFNGPRPGFAQPTASAQPSPPSSLSRGNRQSILRAGSKERGVRFSADTVERDAREEARREAEARARAAEQEQERQRAEEAEWKRLAEERQKEQDERRKQDLYRAEVARARQRREGAKQGQPQQQRGSTWDGPDSSTSSTDEPSNRRRTQSGPRPSAGGGGGMSSSGSRKDLDSVLYHDRPPSLVFSNPNSPRLMSPRSSISTPPSSVGDRPSPASLSKRQSVASLSGQQRPHSLAKYSSQASLTSLDPYAYHSRSSLHLSQPPPPLPHHLHYASSPSSRLSQIYPHPHLPAIPSYAPPPSFNGYFPPPPPMPPPLIPHPQLYHHHSLPLLHPHRNSYYDSSPHVRSR